MATLAKTWRVYGPETLAYRMDKSELPSFFFKKHIVVGPGEGAIVVRDGKAEELITESKCKVQGFWESVGNAVLGWLKTPADVQVIFVDLTPVRLPIYVGETDKREEFSVTTQVPNGWQSVAGASKVAIQAVTADKQVVTAECIVTVRLEPEGARYILGLMKNGRAVARMELAAMIRDDLLARVLVPKVAEHKGDELRGNRDLASSIGSWARAELQSSLATWGLSLVDFTINWGLTDQERFEVGKRREEFAEETRKFGHEMRLAQMGRDLEVEKTKIDNLQQCKLAQAQGNEDLADLWLAGWIKREGMKYGTRIDVAKVDAEVRGIQLGVQKLESTLRLETRRAEETLRLDVSDREWRQENDKRLAAIDAEDKEMRNMAAMQIQMATAKHDREMSARRLEVDSDFRRLQAEIDARYEERKIRLEEDLARMAQVKDVMTAGLSGGAVTAAVMSTFLTESTRQSFGTTTDAKTAAVFDSERAKNELGTYQAAEDRERSQQNQSTRLAADLMQASKQTPGPAVVTGLGGGGGQSGLNVVTLPAGTPPSLPAPGAPPALPAGPTASATDDLTARLGKLKTLHQAGLIDDDEYKQRKAAILAEV